MKLKMQDLGLFNLVFESDPGWILDFSNPTLTAFFDEEHNIDIDDERYQEEGTSKAKRVRCLLKQVDRETALRVLAALWQYKTESMPEQAELSRNDWIGLISRLENMDADTAGGYKPVQVWHGIDWPSLINEMNEMKTLAPQPGVSGLKADLLNCSVRFSWPHVRLSETQANRSTAVSG